MSEVMKKATRDGFGDEIVALGKENHDILVVDVDTTAETVTFML